MASNTNTLWYVIVGAIIVLAIGLGIYNITPDLINNSFGDYDESINVDGYHKNEIKYQCFVFRNIRIENRCVYADIQNICSSAKSYNIIADLYENESQIVMSVPVSIWVPENSTTNRYYLMNVGGRTAFHTLKIRKG